MVADAAELRGALELFADPAAGCELMALTSGVHRTLPGCDIDGLVRAAGELPGGIGIYFRVNPVPVPLRRPAKDADVPARRWLYVDVDPVKPEEFKDHPATDSEMAAAGVVCDSVNEFMQEAGWPAPVIVESGNGYGMFWRCDFPNDPIVRAAYQRWLVALSQKFSGPGGRVDRSVHNASRLVKLPGTWARKGPQSDDRPHRPCRIRYRPAEIVSVALEQLMAAAGPEKSKAGADPVRVAPAPSPPGATPDERYGRKALDNECSRVVFADERNNALNRAAFSLSQLVAGGVLNEDEVRDRLTDAARRAGLDRDPGCGDRGIAATIDSGFRAGKEHPRRPEQKTDPTAVIGRKELLDGVKAGKTSLTVPLSAVTPMAVDWLIPGRVPKRFITVFAGRTGVGKSFVSCDLIARLTTGDEIPGAGGLCFEPGGALVISEDSHEYVLAPRLIGLGADLSRVNAMTWEAMGKYQLGDTDMLGMACDEVKGGVSLVMIDPPTNFLDDVDEHKNSEVRQLVMKVVEWCFGRDLAVLFVLHVNKQTGKGVEAINRVMGSVAWVSTARIAHSFCLDPDDPTRGLWMPTKSNLGQLPKGLAYRIEEGGKVAWLGEVDITADEAMSAGPKERKRSVVASDWLVERFREKREWTSEDLFAAAKEEGISRNAVFAAKDMLKLPKARQNFTHAGDKRWVWWVPEDWPPLSRDDSGGSPTGTVGQWDTGDGRDV